MPKKLLLLLVLFTFTASVSAEQAVHLMANNSPPYADERLPQRGLALELVSHVFARTDYDVSVGIEAWSRSLEGAQIGVYDGLAAVWYSEERSADLLFSEPYLNSKLVIIKRRSDDRAYRTLSDLAGGRLGVRADYAYGVDFASVRNLTLVQENHLIQNLLRLLNGSVDFVIGDQRTVNHQLHEFLKDRMGEFNVTAIRLPPVARHVAASRSVKGHEAIIEAFNRALAESREDGSHTEIVSRWDARYKPSR